MVAVILVLKLAINTFTRLMSIQIDEDSGMTQSRLLRSAAQRALRSERRSQKWERERERRSLKKLGARARAALYKKAER